MAFFNWTLLNFLNKSAFFCIRGFDAFVLHLKHRFILNYSIGKKKTGNHKLLCDEKNKTEVGKCYFHKAKVFLISWISYYCLLSAYMWKCSDLCWQSYSPVHFVFCCWVETVSVLSFLVLQNNRSIIECQSRVFVMLILSFFKNAPSLPCSWCHR